MNGESRDIAKNQRLLKKKNDEDKRDALPRHRSHRVTLRTDVVPKRPPGVVPEGRAPGAGSPGEVGETTQRGDVLLLGAFEDITLGIVVVVVVKDGKLLKRSDSVRGNPLKLARFEKGQGLAGPTKTKRPRVTWTF